MHGMGTRGAVNSAIVRRLVELAEREGVNMIGLAETLLASSMVDTQMEVILRNTGWRWIGRNRKKCKSSGPGRPSGGVGLVYRAELGVVTVGKDQGCDGLLWATWSNGLLLQRCTSCLAIRRRREVGIMRGWNRASPSSW